MATQQARLNLGNLPAPELLHIASFLKPHRLYSQKHKHLDVYAEFTPVPTDLVSLSSVSKSTRQALGAVVFARLVLGEEERSKGYKKDLEELLKMKDQVLVHVNHVLMMDVYPDAVPALVKCFEAIPNLRFYSHEAHVPVITEVARLLCQKPSLEGLSLTNFAADSLPSFVNLAHPLEMLVVNAEPCRPLNLDMLKLAPMTVAVKRRSKKKFDDPPTPEENTAALVDGLARLLLLSHNTLETLDVQLNGIFTQLDLFIQLWAEMKRRNGGEYPVFSQLRRFGFRPGFIDSPAFQHLIKTSKLTQLCIGEMMPKPLALPEVPLTRLKAFHYYCADNLPIAQAVEQFIGPARGLTELELNGFHTNEILKMYGSTSPIRSLPIRTLDLGILDGRFTRKDLVAIIMGSPQGVEIKLTAKNWSCTWEQVSEVFGRYLKAQYLYIDHPIVERPHGPVTPWSTGHHIRSDAEGDFRIISTMGGGTPTRLGAVSVSDDIKAATRFYKAKFLALGKAVPTLETLVWIPTAEVVWRWSFKRAQGKLVAVEENAEINFEGRDGQNQPVGAGVMMQG